MGKRAPLERRLRTHRLCPPPQTGQHSALGFTSHTLTRGNQESWTRAPGRQQKPAPSTCQRHEHVMGTEVCRETAWSGPCPLTGFLGLRLQHQLALFQARPLL